MESKIKKIISQAKKYSLLEQLLKEDPAVPPAPPAPPAAPAAPAPDMSMDALLGGTDPAAAGQEGIPGQDKPVALDDVVDRLNVIRGGKSLKDPQVYTELNTYFASLQEPDRKQLFDFLNKISQIITGTAADDQNTAQTTGTPATPPDETVSPAPPATPAPVAPVVAPAPAPAAPPVNVT